MRADAGLGRARTFPGALPPAVNWPRCRSPRTPYCARSGLPPAHGRCIADGIPHRAPGWTRIPWPQIALACPNGVNPAVGPDPASGADEQERGGDVVVLQRDRGFRVDTVRPRKVPARIAGMGVVAW
jgi:hypothetical protein